MYFLWIKFTPTFQSQRVPFQQNLLRGSDPVLSECDKAIAQNVVTRTTLSDVVNADEDIGLTSARVELRVELTGGTGP